MDARPSLSGKWTYKADVRLHRQVLKVAKQAGVRIHHLHPQADVSLGGKQSDLPDRQDGRRETLTS